VLVPIDEAVHFDVVTHNPSTGAVSDADSTPTFDVFEEATDTPILDDQNFTKRTSLTGNYRGTFTASAANGFEAGKWYVVVASATVNSVAGKTVAMHFRVAPAENQAGVPKVDVTHALGTAWNSGAITADTLATDCIGASELAASAVTEIQAGLSTHSAADVWAVATRVLTAGTNIQLPANGLANVTAWTVDITGNLSGSVGSVAGNVGGNVVGSVASVTAAVTVGTNNDKTGYALTAGERTSIAAAVWAAVAEGAHTFADLMRGVAAFAMGKSSGGGTATIVFRDLGDTKDRITATATNAGNRTAVTRDLT
jgi:hypothetical protein